MTIIVVSGTPGTGKTKLAKKIAKHKKYKYVDVNRIIDKYKLAEHYDQERKTKVVDINKINKFLIKLITEERKKQNSLVIDSHLAHYLPKEYVDKVIITKCNLKTLKKRLEKRNYDDKKIRENLDAEIFDICRVEALEKGHNVEVIYTDKN